MAFANNCRDIAQGTRRHSFGRAAVMQIAYAFRNGTSPTFRGASVGRTDGHEAPAKTEGVAETRRNHFFIDLNQ
jgi:hypothetical protein